MKAFCNAGPSQPQAARDSRRHQTRKPFRSQCSFSPHLRFINLRFYVEELDALKSAVDEPRHSIKKTETQKILIQKEQRWRPWKSEKFGFQPAPPLCLVAKQPGRQVFVSCIAMQPGLRFPVRVLIVLANITRERFDIVVRDCISQLACFSGDHHVLVNLGISHGGVLIFEAALEMPFAATKQRELVESRRCTPQLLSQKMHAQFDVIAVVFRLANSLSDFVGEFGCERFIGIEKQNPFVRERKRVQCPLPLFGPTAMVMKLNNLRAGCAGNLNCVILTLRVDDEYLATSAQRL